MVVNQSIDLNSTQQLDQFSYFSMYVYFFERMASFSSGSKSKPLFAEADSSVSEENVYDQGDQFQPSLSSTPLAWRTSGVNVPDHNQEEPFTRTSRSRNASPELRDDTPLAFLFPPRPQPPKSRSNTGGEPSSPVRSVHPSTSASKWIVGQMIDWLTDLGVNVDSIN